MIMKTELMRRLCSLEQIAQTERQKPMNETEAIALAKEIVALGIDNIPASSLLSCEQIYRMAQEYLTARIRH
jgi:hypothetical protein